RGSWTSVGEGEHAVEDLQRAVDGQDQRGHQDRCGEREDDMADEVPSARAVETSRLQHVLGDVDETGVEKRAVETHRSPDVHDGDHDEGAAAVAEPVDGYAAET